MLNYYLSLVCTDQPPHYYTINHQIKDKTNTYSKYALLYHNDSFRIVSVDIKNSAWSNQNRDWWWRPWLTWAQYEYVKKIFRVEKVGSNGVVYYKSLYRISKEYYKDKYDALMKLMKENVKERYGIIIPEDLKTFESDISTYYNNEIKRNNLEHIDSSRVMKQFIKLRKELSDSNKQLNKSKERETYDDIIEERRIEAAMRFGTVGANQVLIEADIYNDRY